VEERNCTQIRRDNPNLDCLIEVGTKAWVRADVWGDAAGTAPAVTSVRASAFDRFLRLPTPLKSTFKRISWFAPFLYGLARGLSGPGEPELRYDQSISLDRLRELAGIV
jgi:hypothetical protein